MDCQGREWESVALSVAAAWGGGGGWNDCTDGRNDFFIIIIDTEMEA